MSPEPELVNVTVDGKQIRVPKGTNLIEAARQAGVEIPHYCYHPHLSIAGNCRMCQVQVEGQPKLTIACNTTAQEGMVVRTQESSKESAEAQRATLEFLLINHPLDCTVCDQAGHCKLQDYYYEYNAKPSRFTEEKVHKVKAEVLGPEVIYDGERCIVCTRCVRFCDEVTETGELGVFNRGDHSVIGISGGKELTNPLSGSVVDLCPVGALTHRKWRFNTRIWYTQEKNSLCVGCSTGCNVRAAVRDGQIVHVKARLNSAVNKEWLCDEGRYGFHRFQPEARLSDPVASGVGKVDWKRALSEAAKLKSAPSDTTAAVFLSPFLATEEIFVALFFAEKVMGIAPQSGRVAGQVRLRKLTRLEEILVSPDYAPNARAFSLFGLGQNSADWRASLAAQYEKQLADLRAGKFKKVLFVGDLAVTPGDIDAGFIDAVKQCDVSVAITPRDVPADANGSAEKFIVSHCTLSLPSTTVYEKSGIFVNRDGRFQRARAFFPPVVGALPEWILLNRIAEAAGVKLVPQEVVDDRALFRYVASHVHEMSEMTLMKIGDLGILPGEVALGGAAKSSASTESVTA